MFSTRGDVLLCGGEVHRRALASGGGTLIIFFFTKSSRAPNTAGHRANAEGMGLPIGFLKITERHKGVK
jgi:hypothetical protein